MLTTRKTLLGLGTAAIVGAWYNGRRARASWDPTPEIEILRREGRKTNVLNVLFVGSFVQPAEAAHGIIKHLLDYGDVMLVKYSLVRYELGIPAKTTFEHFAPLQYDTANIFGGSLGGREAQRFALLLLEHQRLTADDILLIGTGVPDGWDCLPVAARVAPYVHPGPITNFVLSKPVTRQWFRIPPEDTWSPGTTREAMQANMAAMRSHVMSLIADQITACGKRDDTTDFNPLKPVRSVYILTPTDDVVDQTKCAIRWHNKLPRTKWIFAKSVGHFTWAEHSAWWWDAIHEGLEYFGVEPLEASVE